MRGAWALALVAAASSLARADQTPAAVPEKARELADRGRVLHDRGDYSAAIAAFEEAYVLAPSAGLLFNLAQDYRLAGECDDAAWMYRRYLDSNPAPERRAIAQTHLTAVEKCGHGGLLVIAAPVVDVKIADPREGATAIDARLQVSDEIARDKHAAIGFAIAGGVLAVGTTYFAIGAADAADSVSSSYANGKGKNVGATDASGRSSGELAIGFGIASAASLATAGVFYWLGWRAEHVSLAPLAHGSGAAVAWRF